MLCCHWSDEFVRSYLRIHHVDKPVWRTGGLRPSNNNTFYWYRRGSRGRHHAFTYSAWPPSRDLAATTNRVTLVLRRFQTAGQEGVGMADFRFRWDIDKPGSAKQPENYAYPFICEAKANSKPKLTLGLLQHLVVNPPPIFLANFTKTRDVSIQFTYLRIII